MINRKAWIARFLILDDMKRFSEVRTHRKLVRIVNDGIGIDDDGGRYVK